MRNACHRSFVGARRFQAITWVVAVLILLVLAGCGNASKTTISRTPSKTAASSPTPGELTSFGATKASWNAQHKKSSASGTPCTPFGCYGPTITTPEGHVPQFTSIVRYQGRITGFTYSMPTKTSEAEAKEEVRTVLPSDATVTTSGTIGAAPHDCFVWNLRSKKLAHTLGSSGIGDKAGSIGVIFFTVGYREGYIGYNPDNVNEALLSIVARKPTKAAGRASHPASAEVCQAA